MMGKRFFQLIVLLILCTPWIYAQQQTITGTVIDKVLNEPIAGAAVTITGSAAGTATDMDGKFTISANIGDALKISYIGYITQTITIENAKTYYEIQLMEDLQNLEEVVVVGYATQKKVNLTGAVSTVDTKTMENRPVTTLSEALQGSVPGLNITQSNNGGQLGATMNVNIRGTGTISTGSSAQVLILIDGIEGNMNNVNPNDIESISVLKDAAAASIYGSRAAFGVILITTKKGRTGKVTVSYGNNFRYSGPTKLPNVANSYSFAHYFNESSINGGGNEIFNEETLNRILAYQKGEITTSTVENTGNGNWQFHERANDDVNWYKKHFQWAWTQEHNMNLRGGNEALLYYTSISWLDQNGNLKFGDDQYQRFNAMAKVNAKINKYIDFNINTKFIRYQLDNPLYSELGGLLYHDILRMWPMMPYKDPNGHYMRNGKLAQLTNGSRSITNNDNLYGQAQLVLHPTQNWNITAEAGARVINQNNQKNLNKVYEYNVAGEPLLLAYGSSYVAGQTMAETTYASSNHYTYNVYTDYTLEKSNHYAKLMVGMNAEDYKYRTLGAKRDDLITESVPEISAATGDDKITTSNIYDWSTVGFFGRINYDYMGKYLLEFNLRYDGSSRFLSDDRWGLFPSVSVGWNLAKENFFSDMASNMYINMLKPRASWGSLGNQYTNSYYPMYLTQPVSTGNGTWLMDGANPNTSSVPGAISSSLTWETVESTNIGLDLAMLKNRLNVNFDYYIRKTKNMVGPASEIAAIYGIAMPNTNNATLRNNGWEITVNWKDVIGNVKYNIGFNLYDSKTKVTSYPNASKSLTTYYEGKILGEIWGLTTHGIAKSQTEMDTWLVNNNPTWGSNWTEGDIMYCDLNGDGVINKGANTLDDSGDYTVIGNNTPRYHFGINLSAEYKNFDISMFLQGIMKRDLWLDGAYFWGAGSGEWQMTCFDEHLDYYRPENTTSFFGSNTDAYFPRIYMNSTKNQYTQTRYLQNGAYMRFKNIQIGYTLPKTLLGKAGIEHLRIYVSGENLWTLTALPEAYDPEALNSAYSGEGTGKTYPLSSTFSFGLNLTF